MSWRAALAMGVLAVGGLGFPEGAALAQFSRSGRSGPPGSVGSVDGVPADQVDRASAVLVIQAPGGGSSVGGLDPQTVSAFLSSTEAIDRSIARSLKRKGTGSWEKVASVSLTPVGGQSFRVEVAVAREAFDIRPVKGAEKEKEKDPGSPEADRPARALLRGLVAVGREAVDRMVAPRRLAVVQRLETSEQKRKAQRDRLEAARKQLKEVAHALGVQEGSMPTSYPPGLSRSVGETQRRSIEADLALKRARRDALKEAVAQSREEPDELAVAFRSLVEARERLVELLEKRVREEGGDPIRLLDARAALADARVKQAEHVRRPLGTTSLSYGDELRGLEVEIRAMEYQIKALPAPRPGSERAPDVADFQRLQSEVSQLQSELQSNEFSHAQIVRELEQLGPAPTLMILGE